MLKSIVISAVALFVAASPVTAATFFKATLLGSNEVPPNASTASGTGLLSLSADDRFATVTINFTGMSAPLAAGHAHCCALPGANAGVAINFAPPSLTEGSFNRVYDLTDVATWNPTFLTNNGGTAASAQAAFLAGLNSGQVYFNLHTSNFPGGEIRGNLAMVPEPASWAMLLTGFGAVGGVLRRRRVMTS